MIVDGERLRKSEVRRLVTLFDNECKQVAGDFFDQCRKGAFGDPGRSAKFRAFWTEVGLRCGRDAQFCYVETHYTHFAGDVRKAWAGLLARPDVREEDKALMHKALIIQQMLGSISQHTPLQMARNTQGFAGDAFENRHLSAVHGDHAEPSMVNKLLGSTNFTKH